MAGLQLRGRSLRQRAAARLGRRPPCHRTHHCPHRRRSYYRASGDPHPMRYRDDIAVMGRLSSAQVLGAQRRREARPHQAVSLKQTELLST